jgi:hypothetical protein
MGYTPLIFTVYCLAFVAWQTLRLVVFTIRKVLT